MGGRGGLATAVPGLHEFMQTAYVFCPEAPSGQPHVCPEVAQDGGDTETSGMNPQSARSTTGAGMKVGIKMRPVR